MARHFKVSPLSNDSDLRARSLELTINNKPVVTPCRALYFQPNNDYSESRIISNGKLRGINEIYLQPKFEDLNLLRKDVARQKRLIASLDNAITKSDIEKDEIIFTFFHYDARQPHQRREFLDTDTTKKRKERRRNPNYKKTALPSKDETDYIARLYASLPHDTLIPPILQGADGVTYLAFLKQFFEVVESCSWFKSKPIMGLIPNVSDFELGDILEFYNKKDVRLYAMNFGSGQPLHYRPHLIKIMTFFEQIEKDYKEYCYLHGVNVRFGRMMEKPVVPARDVLGFSAGLDSFGLSHLGGGSDEKIEGTAEEKRRKLLEKLIKNTALFGRKDYGYHKYEKNSDELGKVFKDEKDVVYNLKSLKGATTATELRNIVRVFNAERHAIEANHLGEEIIGKKAMRDYFSAKGAVDKNTMKELSKIGDRSRQGRL